MPQIKKQYINLIDIILFLLVVLSYISRIYIISQTKWMLDVINYMQFPLYMGMVFIIIKKKYSIKLLFLTACVEIILLIGYMQSGQAAYFRGVLLLLAIKGLPFKRILRVCRVAISSTVVLSLVLFFLGISDAGVMRRGYVAFGYGQPNMAAQVITIIALMLVAEKAETLSGKHYVAIEIIGVMVFLITGSRTATIVLLMTPIMIVVIKKLMTKKVLNSVSALFLQGFQLLMFIFSWLISKMLPNNAFLKAVDLLFANRLFLNYYQLENHPVTAFGQNIELQVKDVYNNIQNVWGAMVTCDSTYVMSLIIMGIIPTLIFMAGYVILMHKALRDRNYIVVAIALLLALYGFFEAQLIEIYNNFVYFYVTAEFILPKLEIDEVNRHDT